MEGVSSRPFLVDAVTNNTFSLQSTENAILQVMHHSFNYLLNAQREFIDLNRFNFTNSDIRTGMGKFWLEADADLIEQTARKAYRVSEFYNKELTLDEMNAHREIFIKVPVLYIDGVPTFAFKVRARLDKMEIYLQIDKYFIKKPHEYTVLFIHNNGYKEIKSNKYIMDKYGNDLPNNFFGPALQTKNRGGMYLTTVRDINSPIGSSFNTTHLTQNTVNIVADEVTNEIIHSSREINVSVINFRYIYSMEKEYEAYYKDDGTLAINTVVIEGKDSEYLAMPVPVENMFVLKYNAITQQWLLDNHITIEQHYPNIYIIKDENLTYGDKYRVFYFYYETDDLRYRNKLDAYHYLLLFKFGAGAEMPKFLNYLAQEEKLDPNIFQFSYEYIAEHFPHMARIMQSDIRAEGSQPNVINMNPDLGIGAAQVIKVGDLKDDPSGGGGKVEDFSKENVFDALLKLVERSSDNYQAFFDEFFTYQDGVYTYSNADFRETYHPNHFDYKVNKLRDYISADPESLRTYMYDQYHTGRKYFLFAKDIDLEDRRRTNNHKEASKDSDKREFDEPCYMFAFRNNDENFLNLRIFVNGLLYTPKYSLLDKTMEYFYIPCSMIDELSWVEIERFEDYRLHEVIDMEVNTPYEIRVIVDSRKTAYDAHVGDLYFVDSTTGKYIPNEDFKVEMTIDGSYEDISNREWCVLSTFRVTLLNEEHTGKRIYVKISKTPYYSSFVTLHDGIVTHSVSPHIKRMEDYFRVFVDGRLLPEVAWSLGETADDNWDPEIRLNYVVPAGSVVAIDATPYRYQKVHYLKEIPSNSIVDLGKIIDKPFDLHYYDIYLNGRKLGEANVIYLSPTKIKLINIHSSYNLEIWQKERGDEYYGFVMESDSWKTVVDRLLESDKLTEDEKDCIVDNIVNEELEPGFFPEENDNTEDDEFPETIFSDEDVDMYLFYEERLIPLPENYLNPDIKQFNHEDIQRRYPSIAKRMLQDKSSKHPNVVVLNPDVCPAAKNVIMIGGPVNTGEFDTTKLRDSRLSIMYTRGDFKDYSKIILFSDYPTLSGIYVQSNSTGREAAIARLEYPKNSDTSYLKVPVIGDKSNNGIGFID